MSVDEMADVVGADRVVAGVIEVTAAMYEPGLVERHTPPAGSWFALGGIHPVAQARAASVAAVLGAAGAVEVVDDIRSAKWMKLSVNAAELVPSAILDLPLLEARALPGMHDFMLAAGREAVRTAVALGHGVVPILGLTDVDPGKPEAFLDTMLGTVYEKWSLPQTRTTVLQDWMKGRRSEASEINGLVVREQQRLGGSAPANAVTLDIALGIERGDTSAGAHHRQRMLSALG
jgi:2-dehydropantoate 2-reductase